MKTIDPQISKELARRSTGEALRVPNNPLCKIQYYFKAVLGLIDIQGDAQLIQVKNGQLDSKQGNHISQLCFMLKPQAFVGSCVFIEPKLCGNYSNEFYSIDNVQKYLKVGKTVNIKGQTKKVKRVMTCKKQWINNNFYKPLAQVILIIDDPTQKQKMRKILSENPYNPQGCSIF